MGKEVETPAKKHATKLKKNHRKKLLDVQMSGGISCSFSCVRGKGNGSRRLAVGFPPSLPKHLLSYSIAAILSGREHAFYLADEISPRTHVP